MNTLPQIKADLITGLDERRAKAEAYIQGVSPDLHVHTDSGSDWTAKDLITHLTAFEEDMVEAIQTFTDGGKYRLDLKTKTNIDDFNEMRRLERADRTWDEALREWREARDQLRGVIIAFPESDIETPFSTPFMQKYPLLQAIKGCGVHEKMHMGEIMTAHETTN